MISNNSRIFITGHKGLVGSAVYNLLKKKKFKKLITADRKKLNLLNTKKVYNFVKKHKINVIINCAAKVGGILANSNNPIDFLYENIQMQNNLLLTAREFKVNRFIFLGSSCIYPKESKTPITEDKLLTGKLEKTNEAYALAKISGIKLSEYLFYKNNLDVVCLMPTNIYGLNDNYDQFSSHVIPGMITKFIEAKKNNKQKVELLGSGKPLREFLINDDLAEAIYLLLKSSKNKIMKASGKKFPIFNVGSGENISIKALSKIIKKYVNFEGEIFFNKKYPDGTMKKNLNSNKIKKLGWKPKINLKKGLSKIIKSKLI